MATIAVMIGRQKQMARKTQRPMKQDNQWHDGIVYRHSDDGSFVLAENVDEIEKDTRPMTMESGGVKYQDVKYNWNRGQPIVDFGDFRMAITDIGFVRLDRQ